MGIGQVQVVSASLLFGLIALLAWLLTRTAIHWVVRLGMQDIPGERSSHVVPTPRGGGIVICGLLLTASAIGSATVSKSNRWFLASLCGGGLVSLIGWVDDRSSVSARVRFSIHLLAALVVVAVAWPQLSISVLPGIGLSGFLAAGFVALFITWMINLYNFMDGIDGLASGQACTVALGISIIAYRHANMSLAMFALLLSSVSFGFLLVNWHPARVFMGDVGSGFIGYLFGLLAVWGELEQSVPFCSVLVLMAYFIVDATWTMLRRATRGERVWHAHRDHAYQHAARSGLSHAQVSGAVICLNLIVLLPAAIICDRWHSAQWPIAVLTYVGTLAGVIRYRAGERMP